MHSPSLFALFALVAPILAAPAAIAQPEPNESAVTALLEARDTTVTCTPNKNKNKSKIKNFKVSVDYAKEQMKIAGFQAGRSGDPHPYGGSDGIVWGNEACDKKNAPYLLEYPVFWVGSSGKTGQLAWEKDVKTEVQSLKQRTPLRVVYANQNGGFIYCGIMTHSEVTADFQGKDFFTKCT